MALSLEVGGLVDRGIHSVNTAYKSAVGLMAKRSEAKFLKKMCELISSHKWTVREYVLEGPSDWDLGPIEAKFGEEGVVTAIWKSVKFSEAVWDNFGCEHYPCSLPRFLNREFPIVVQDEEMKLWDRDWNLDSWEENRTCGAIEAVSSAGGASKSSFSWMDLLKMRIKNIFTGKSSLERVAESLEKKCFNDDDEHFRTSDVVLALKASLKSRFNVMRDLYGKDIEHCINTSDTRFGSFKNGTTTHAALYCLRLIESEQAAEIYVRSIRAIIILANRRRPAAMNYALSLDDRRKLWKNGGTRSMSYSFRDLIIKESLSIITKSWRELTSKESMKELKRLSDLCNRAISSPRIDRECELEAAQELVRLIKSSGRYRDDSDIVINPATAFILESEQEGEECKYMWTSYQKLVPSYSKLEDCLIITLPAESTILIYDRKLVSAEGSIKSISQPLQQWSYDFPIEAYLLVPLTRTLKIGKKGLQRDRKKIKEVAKALKSGWRKYVSVIMTMEIDIGREVMKISMSTLVESAKKIGEDVVTQGIAVRELIHLVVSAGRRFYCKQGTSDYLEFLYKQIETKEELFDHCVHLMADSPISLDGVFCALHPRNMSQKYFISPRDGLVLRVTNELHNMLIDSWKKARIPCRLEKVGRRAKDDR